VHFYPHLCTLRKTSRSVTHPKIALGQSYLTPEFFAGGLPKKKVYLIGMSILSILLSLEPGCHKYIDDTILFLENDLEKAGNVKLLLSLYEHMSGLKINFDKSEILLVGGDDNLAISYAKMFNYQIGTFPLKYLEVPISAGRLHVIDWAIWKRNLLKHEMYSNEAPYQLLEDQLL
jgi:hypothetical protein